MAKTVFSWAAALVEGIGWGVVILWLAGALGIGHFRLYYGPSPAPTCGKVAAAKVTT